MTGKDWKNDKYVVNWFQLLGNERTISNYSDEFPKFLDFVKANTSYRTPSEIIDSRLKHLVSTDIRERRFWEDLTVKYKNSLQSKDRSMHTVKGYLRTVMSFFAKNGVKLLFSRGELKVEPSTKDKVVKSWIPSNEDVRLLYRMANNSRDRALLLMLYQSGFSEVDVAAMNMEDFPFYDESGNWRIPLNEDLYHARLREKTNILQQTCVSREALEEIRIMLQSRGFPKTGKLFVSFRNQPLDVREIDMAVKSVVEKAFNGKIKEWKTKNLRDAYMNGLLQAKLTQELKDSMVGHKRQGARASYGLTEQTVKTAYEDAFKFLTINGFGSQSRKLEELEKKQQQDVETLTKVILDQKQQIDKLEADLTNIQKGLFEVIHQKPHKPNKQTKQ